MFVLKDRHHDAIIGQIGVKRMADLRKMAEFDPANSAEEEKAKLRWLQSEGALSAEEALYLQNRLPAEAA